MKAPEKIYLWETLIVNGGYDPAWHKNSFNEGDVEYIRKDALMEWARRMIADDKNRGKKGGYYDLIDKLNSL